MAARRERVTPRARAEVRSHPGAAPAVGRVVMPAATGPLPRTFYRTPDGEVRTGLSEPEVAAAFRSGVGDLWVDIDVRRAEQHEWLRRVFQFHPLAIEDTLNPNSRVKYDEYPDALFVIVRSVRLDESTADPYDLATGNLCLFLGPHFLVSVHRTDESVCHELAARLAASTQVPVWSVARLMHTLVDLSVDRYFPILDQLDDFVDRLEERVFERNDPTVLHEAYCVKRLVLTLRRHLGPQRDVLNALTNRPSALLPPDVQVYFRDVYDHVLRITDTLDTYRELLGSTVDASLSLTSNRLATVTKTLSVMATLSIPFVMLSGMWGMNFAHVPLGGHPHGFAIMMLVQFGLGALILVVLRVLRLL